MFNAAHLALFALQIEDVRAPIKTRSELIAKFGEHLVRTGHLPAEYGEALNAVQRSRQIADYNGEPIELDKAAWSVERADAFVAAVRASCESHDLQTPDPPHNGVSCEIPGPA
jgi:uncharacterized protein (UPF0332 family)